MWGLSESRKYDLDIFPEFVIFLTNFNHISCRGGVANKVTIEGFDYPQIEPIDHFLTMEGENWARGGNRTLDAISKRKDMETNRVIFITLLALFMSILLCACANVKFIPHGKTFPPYTGEIKVIWKEPRLLPNPNSYDFIGTVTGSVIFCTVIPAMLDTDLHNRLIKEASKYGGNGIILYCGEMGAVDECKCYGDIIRFK